MTAHTAEAFFAPWKLDRTSGVPLHVQIERLLHDLIRRPPYSTGALLPDELTMASRLGVSRGTVRESILNLVHQGFLAQETRGDQGGSNRFGRVGQPHGGDEAKGHRRPVVSVKSFDKNR